MCTLYIYIYTYIHTYIHTYRHVSGKDFQLLYIYIYIITSLPEWRSALMTYPMGRLRVLLVRTTRLYLLLYWSSALFSIIRLAKTNKCRNEHSSLFWVFLVLRQNKPVHLFLASLSCLFQSLIGQASSLARKY